MELPIESNKRELIYTDEFKELIHNHPGILSSFLKFNKTLKSQKVEEGTVFEEGGLRVTVIGYKDWGEDAVWRRDGYYLKVDIEGHEFFIKTIPGYRHYAQESGGVEEFQSLQRARELLSGQPDIEVIDFQLGYQDEDSDTSYFVSKWTNAVRLEDYKKKLKSSSTTPFYADDELVEILKTVKRLREILHGEFFDIEGNQNLLYDPSTKKVIVFDIHSANNLIARQKKSNI